MALEVASVSWCVLVLVSVSQVSGEVEAAPQVGFEVFWTVVWVAVWVWLAVWVAFFVGAFDVWAV